MAKRQKLDYSVRQAIVKLHNPIEKLWKTLGVKVMERNPTNTEDLWVKLQEEWSKISIEDCQELIRSCSRRCADVIESKGSFTKY